MEKIELLYSETKHMLAQIKGAPESDELVQAIEDFLKTRWLDPRDQAASF